MKPPSPSRASEYTSREKSNHILDVRLPIGPHAQKRRGVGLMRIALSN